MVGVNPFHIHRYLNVYGWNFEYKDAVWKSQWDGEQTHFSLEISLSETFVHFRVIPLVKISIDSLQSESKLLNYLMYMNSQINLLRLSMQEKGRIDIQTEILTKDLCYEKFSHTIGIIGYYCDALYENFMQFSEDNFTSDSGEFL